MYWNHLIHVALLGTDKQQPDLTQLPEPLQALVRQLDTADKEAFFYKTAALAWQYRRAGTNPEKDGFPETPPAPPEEKPYCSANALLTLKKILSEENPNPALLNMWTEKCAGYGWIVPPELLVQVLNAGATLKKEYSLLQEKIKEVTGKRGLWMRQFNKDWLYLQTPDYEQLWQEGKTAERKEAFAHFRQTDPPAALERLKKTWKDENVAAKRDFLQLLKPALSADDEPFLEEVYQEIITARQKKDVYTDLLTQTVALLFALPDARLSRETFEKIKPYLKTGKEKKLLGLLSGKPKLELPEKEDDFFNAGNMFRNFGFDKISNKVTTHSDSQYWFEAFVSLLPPTYWQQHLGLTPAETVKVFSEEEGFVKKGKSLFVNALCEAVCFHQSQEWAAPLAALLKDNLPTSVTGLLEWTELEKFVKEHAPWHADLRSVLLQKSTEPWSEGFTEQVFKKMLKGTNNYNYFTEDRQFVEKAIRLIHPRIVKVVSDLPREETPDWQKQQWYNQVVLPLGKLLEIRQDIENL